MAIKKLCLEKYWDEKKVCKNPHKGWYLHYYDNGLSAYGDRIEKGDFLLDFPGLNHIYLRLPWCHLEPEEGLYRWDILDDVIDSWRTKGYTVSFRVTCKETGIDQKYATPLWVKNAGAKGNYTCTPWDSKEYSWEPDYGNPIFLEKLESFHKAFSERYDNKPWVEYIDIGSYGDWGEGHTAASSRKEWPVEVIKKHIDIHTKYYKKATLVISDDIVGSREALDGTKEEILQYILEKGITLRDDGVCVKWFADRFGFSTLRSPEMFDMFWEKSPVNLELEHYHATIENGTWKDGLPFMSAVLETHATFLGFHGYPREWLNQNPDICRTLANKCGYWYFLKSIEYPEVIKRGETFELKLVWENHGVAPAYHKYSIEVIFEDLNEVTYRQPLLESDNRKWMPSRIIGESYAVVIPEDFVKGNSKIRLAIYETLDDGKNNIELAFTDSIKAADGSYYLAEVLIT